jgi:hypothetical protein
MTLVVRGTEDLGSLTSSGGDVALTIPADTTAVAFAVASPTSDLQSGDYGTITIGGIACTWVESDFGSSTGSMVVHCLDITGRANDNLEFTGSTGNAATWGAVYFDGGNLGYDSADDWSSGCSTCANGTHLYHPVARPTEAVGDFLCVQALGAFGGVWTYDNGGTEIFNTTVGGDRQQGSYNLSSGTEDQGFLLGGSSQFWSIANGGVFYDGDIVETPDPITVEVEMPAPTVTGVSDIVDHPDPITVEVEMPAPTVTAPVPRQLSLVGIHVDMPGRVAVPGGGLTTPMLSQVAGVPVWVEAPTGVADHGALTGLTDDDHTQYVKDTEFTAKGDTLVGTGSGTFAKRTVGADDTVLTADAAEADGVKWAAAAGGAALEFTDESATVFDIAVTKVTVPDGSLVDNGVGDVTLREVPAGVIGASIYKAADDQDNLTASTSVKITFDTVAFDTDSFFDDANDRLTVPAGLGGLYEVSVIGSIEAGTAGVTSLMQVRVNNTTADVFYRGDNDATSAGGTENHAGSFPLELVAGDYIELYINPGDGGSDWDANGGAAGCRLALVKVGSGNVGDAIGAKAYESGGTQTLTTGVDAAVTFTSEDWDTDGFHSTSSNTSRFTVPAGLGGKYLFNGHVYFASGVNQTLGATKVYVDGVIAENYVIDNFAGTGQSAQTFGIVLDLAAGQYVEVFARQNSGGNITCGSTNRVLSNEASLVRIGGPAIISPGEGTTFPTGPATDARYYRTDVRGGMWFRYDGTRWLSEQMLSMHSGNERFSTETTPLYGFLPSDYDVQLVRFESRPFANAVGANYLTYTLAKRTVANASTTIVTYNTSGDTISNWNDHSSDLSDVLDTSTYAVVSLVVAYTGSAASYGTHSVWYRLIAT